MQDTTMISSLTLGLDLGDRKTKIAVLDVDGEIVEESTVTTNPQSFKAVFSRFRGAVAAMEVGSQSRWASDLLSQLGLVVYVANPRQLKLIYQSTDKDDRLDAQRLARLARFDPSLLKPVKHRGDETQCDLEILKARGVLVEVRTKLVNHVRGVLKSFGVSVKRCDPTAFAAQALDVIPDALLPGLVPLLDSLDDINAKIREFDKTIQNLCRSHYKVEIDTVCQVNGVGPITGLTYILTIGDPSRFRKSRDVGSYLGLRPRRADSGSSAPELRISKCGDPRLRSLLVQSAHYILGPFGKDCDLRKWGLGKAEGGKRAKKRAVVAVARKLSVLLHRLLLTGEIYDPFRQAASERIAS
ncbi:MAG: IS110 family transposase [Kangiellaceae bacterium]|jgi:transposase|nr:IS110 family transposase [Kangiellaceae bacterium]